MTFFTIEYYYLYIDVHLKAYYTDDYSPSLCYESSRFNEFSNVWALTDQEQRSVLSLSKLTNLSASIDCPVTCCSSLQ